MALLTCNPIATARVGLNISTMNYRKTFISTAHWIMHRAFLVVFAGTIVDRAVTDTHRAGKWEIGQSMSSRTLIWWTNLGSGCKNVYIVQLSL